MIPVQPDLFPVARSWTRSRFAVLAALVIVVIYSDVITNVLLMRKG